jgi:dTDP-4-dehydrorhamnose reductase
MNESNTLEIWGGMECTINRVKDQYLDQSHFSGHYNRGTDDIDLVASLGIKMLRYPVLWEKHQPRKDTCMDWSFVSGTLNRMREQGIAPIAGLVHHGSGPGYVNFFDGSFESGLAEYAAHVANQFPWLEYYTPVNEPLTTARFCGLYGHWFPHGKDDYSFYKILLSECKATVMAMEAIRRVNPGAKLVQTEDLGKCYSTPLLQYQAEMENHRRWLSYDLLCGKVNKQHYMWPCLMQAGITAEEVLYFQENPCVPWVAGFNYYITSERYLDEDLSKYPEHYHGGNCQHRYADIETVKVPLDVENGPALLLREAWEHLQIPLAITECHLHSTREDQIRWFHAMWKTANALHQEGVPIKAITAWALFGLWGWNCLVTKPWGDYEPGVFNTSSGTPRPTALAGFLRSLTQQNAYYHPLLEGEGWWQRSTRHQYGVHKVVSLKNKKAAPACKPVLVLGKTGTLGKAFARICDERHIHQLSLNRADFDITDTPKMQEVLAQIKPWAVINAAGYVNVDKAETESKQCFDANCAGPAALAALCHEQRIPFLSFSSDLVFDGTKGEPYTESDVVEPLNVYGWSKAKGEKAILENNRKALVIRTSSFFGPWDGYNFVYKTLCALKEGRLVEAASDVYMSPTYVPDLVHRCLDLLLDGEEGIFHLANDGVESWKGLAERFALLAGYDTDLIRGRSLQQIKWKAKRPHNSALKTEKGVLLPPLEHALERYLQATGFTYQTGRIAV